MNLTKQATRSKLRSLGVLGVAALASLLITALLPVGKISEYSDIPESGELVKEAIIAPFNFDIIKTQDEILKEQEQVKRRVIGVFRYDNEITEDVFKKISSLENDIMALRSGSIRDSVKASITARLQNTLSPTTIKYLENNPKYIEEIRYIIDKTMDHGVSSVYLASGPDGVDNYKTRYKIESPQFLVYDKSFVSIYRDGKYTTQEVKALETKEMAIEREIQKLQPNKFNPDYIAAVSEILFSFASPNIFYDANETENHRDIEAANVTKVKGKVMRGTMIAKENQIVTEEMAEKLRSLNAAQKRMFKGKRLLKTGPYIGNYLVILFLIVCFFVTGMLVGAWRARAYRNIIALGAILVLQFLVVRGSLLVVERVMLPLDHEFIIPYFSFAIMASIAYGVQIGFIFNFFVALFSGLLFGYNYFIILYILLAGSVACFEAKKIRTRFDFLKLWIKISVACMAVIFANDLIRRDFQVEEYAQKLISSYVGGFLSVIIPVFAQRFFEYASNTTSELTLSHLSNINHPILRKLSVNAAGAFNHSTNVANLVYAGAQAIGEKAVLARTLAFFHDIGKISKSQFWEENKGLVKGKKKSASTIEALKSVYLAHVKEGIRIALDNRFPVVLQETISQHHGTSSVLASMPFEVDSDEVEDDFYPGPKPQNKINAIIMIADMVEMNFYKSGTKNVRKINGIIKQSVDSIVQTEQLNECNISFVELQKISESFVAVLVSLMQAMDEK